MDNIVTNVGYWVELKKGGGTSSFSQLEQGEYRCPGNQTLDLQLKRQMPYFMST